jgi:hypothetical protein
MLQAGAPGAKHGDTQFIQIDLQLLDHGFGPALIHRWRQRRLCSCGKIGP